MRTIVIVGLLTCLFCVGALAQNSSNFDQLTPTANPAYMILGISPTEIERPSTPKELAASLNTAIVNGRLAPNFVVEFNPYELAIKKKKLSYAEEAVKFTLKKNSFGSNLLNNLVISMATSETDSVALGQLSPGTSFAVGVKTTLFNGRPRPSTVSAMLSLTSNFSDEIVYASIQTKIGSVSTLDELTLQNMIRQTIVQQQNSINSNSNLTQSDKNIRIDRIEFIGKKIEQQIKAEVNWDKDSAQVLINKITSFLEKEVSQLQAQQNKSLATVNKRFAFAREGFIMDVNGAYMGHVESNDGDSVTYGKWAAWTTLSYRQNIDQSFENVALIDIMALLRYTGNNTMVDSANYFDAGLKLRFIINRFALSGEYVGRIAFGNVLNPSGDLYTDRITASLEYRLSNLITLKTSFGRTFDGNTSIYDKSDMPLFGMAGLSLSFLQGQ